jgi:hypothetical protein
MTIINDYNVTLRREERQVCYLVQDIMLYAIGIPLFSCPFAFAWFAI